MHNNLIKDLPDLVETELIQIEKHLTLIVDNKICHIKCTICAKRAIPKKP